MYIFHKIGLDIYTYMVVSLRNLPKNLLNNILMRAPIVRTGTITLVHGFHSSVTRPAFSMVADQSISKITHKLRPSVYTSKENPYVLSEPLCLSNSLLPRRSSKLRLGPRGPPGFPPPCGSRLGPLFLFSNESVLSLRGGLSSRCSLKRPAN